MALNCFFFLRLLLCRVLHVLPRLRLQRPWLSDGNQDDVWQCTGKRWVWVTRMQPQGVDHLILTCKLEH